MQSLDQVNKGLTFEQVKNLIDEKHGKYVVGTFQDEQILYHLYDKGWVECNFYGFFGEELNPLQSLISRTFNSVEEAITEAEKIGFPVDTYNNNTTGEIQYLTREQIKDLIQKEKVTSYGIGIDKIPSWEELELNYSEKDIPNPNFLLEIIGNIMSSEGYSTWIDL